MSTDQVRRWKDPFYRRSHGDGSVANPVGEVMLDDELDEIVGGKFMDTGSGGPPISGGNSNRDISVKWR